MDKMMKKLESMDTSERDKVRQLLREGKGEGSEEKMGWMYQGDKPEEEEYLLGRRIDRHVDNWQEKQDEAAKDAPGALFAEVVAKRADLDMQAKMREDPLYAIRKKEEEARRRLLENPIKMKQLEKMVDDKRAKEDKKKKKKKKKHKHHHHNSSSESSSEDDELIKRYLAILETKKLDSTSSKSKGSSKPIRDRSRNSGKDRYMGDNNGNKGYREKHGHDMSDSEGERMVRRKREASPGDEQDPDMARLNVNRYQQHRGRMDSDSDDNTPRHPKSYGLIVSKSKESTKSTHSSKKSRKRSRSPERSSWSSTRRRSQSPGKQRSRSPARKRSRSPLTKRSRSPKWKGKVDTRTRKGSKSPSRREAPKKKLTAEEKERRLKEMMEDAHWRDDQRSKNVKRYNEEEEKEEKQYLERTGSSSDFLNPMLVTHAGQSSVEDRIKRNKYNLQRTKADLDKAFTKR